MKSIPSMSVARMTPDRLSEVQHAVIPDGGPAALLLGRPRPGVEIRVSRFAARHGDLPLRIYTPQAWSRTARPVVLNFHGGGFVLGSARQGDWICSVVAADLDAIVVSVDYRLAPAHKYPAAVEDCYDALLWTAAHAGDLGGDPARIAVMGDSAGGNLAAVVSILARDERGPSVRHQALIYPATDMTDAALEDASYAANTRGIVLSNEDIDVFRDHYLADADDRADPRLSPIRADLADLPPAVVVVAGLDPLHDSGVRYAQALADAGNAVRVEDFHQMPHGFLSFPYLAHAARPAMAAIVASQRAALG
ncbi:alpha/beta hydrolase [Nocardioides sp. YIM 152315]|uniref:alpha/beta hydrolase n=1 Tax=Nocardioides sp. YIM 152315 TaxID=3031760 RepID=UPI0023DC5283|nr:alpha/beta hydrolase [Nocardioides sp. YIM 152315]MDF1603499.1 alpha/beta hydrolase [Nocardioides sp. YIM 152315]